MFDAISPSDPTIAPGDAGNRADGAAELAFSRGSDGLTRLATLRQRAPMRVLFPKQVPGDLPVAALVNVGGGLVAGDRAAVTVRVDEGAAALVTSQAAEKVYRSTGADTRVTSRLVVEPGGWLEWCPQETILFDRARLRRKLRLELTGDARAMLGEILVLGRLASGERATQGFLLDRIEVIRNGALVWLESFRLDGDYGHVLEASAGLNGAKALATFVHAGPAAARHLDLARDLLLGAEGASAAATVVNELLVVRWLASDPLALRRSFVLFWAGFRAAAAGLPAALPRLWHV
jgi:urease accessory protein